jgi:putative endonuclease
MTDNEKSSINNAESRPVISLQKLKASFTRKQYKLPPEATRSERGRFGEDLAARYCRKKLGYREICRNWSCPQGEIDLICRDHGVLVFIEVRTRAGNALISGAHSVDAKKKKKLRRACRSYLYQLKHSVPHFRFDIIQITLSKNGDGKVRHFINISLFSKHFSAQSYSK